MCIIRLLRLLNQTARIVRLLMSVIWYLKSEHGSGKGMWLPIGDQLKVREQQTNRKNNPIWQISWYGRLKAQ